MLLSKEQKIGVSSNAAQNETRKSESESKAPDLEVQSRGPGRNMHGAAEKCVRRAADEREE